MTNTSTNSEPPETRPSQFTIGSLMILTAGVGGFFALITQIPFDRNEETVITFLYVWLIVIIAGFWNLRKYWKGFLAANIPFLQVLVWQASYPITGIADVYYTRFHLYLSLVFLALVLAGLYLVVLIFVRGNQVEKVVGGASAVLHFWVICLIIYEIYDWVMIYGISVSM